MAKESVIKGGYYLKARCIQESEIAHAPPHVREIWDYLLREANFTDKKYSGFLIKRGQLFRTYKQIREALHWKVGYRKMRYSEVQIKKGMYVLRCSTKIIRSTPAKEPENEPMIDTTKELGGVLITIRNYDFYQTIKNYERTSERTDKKTTKEPTKEPSCAYTKKEKEIKDLAGKNPAVKVIIDFFHKTVLKEKGYKPKINGKASGGIILQCLKENMTEDEIKRCIEYYVNSKKERELGMSLSIALSAHSINLYRQYWQKEKELYA